MKAKIKVGSAVTQDFSFFRWPEQHRDVIFDIESRANGVWNVGSYKCRAHGFGLLSSERTGAGQAPGAYGNGAVYTDIKNLDIVDLEGAKLRFTNSQRTLIFDAAT